MKAESAMWRKVRPFLIAARLDPVRVENPIGPGTPDVNLADGRWIELKCVPAWPPRARNILRIPHFTPQQRVWLYQRWRAASDTTYLLLEVRATREWLLFDGDVAAKVVGRATEGHLRACAHAILAESALADLPKIFAEVDRWARPVDVVREAAVA